MDIKQIHELVKLINKSNIGELSIEQQDFKITIKQKKDPAPVYASAPMAAPMTMQAMPSALSASENKATPAASTDQPKADTSAKEDKYITIKSPMIGTFYRQAGPNKPLFVEVGDEVEPGKVVCIIEAMKLFNEIESEVKGKIVKVLVEDASPVEFDQPLFLVAP